MSDSPPRQTIRSFVKRAGRMTGGQQKALEQLWPDFGIDYSPERLDFEHLFARSGPVILEIGSGNGSTLVENARSNPDQNFLGIEVHEPGVGHCLLLADEAGVHNLRVICHDAIDVLEHQVADASLYGLNIFFPDPWPKKRHHKRRLIRSTFLDIAARKIQTRGRLHIATDWQNYAEHIAAVLLEHPCFTASTDAAPPRTPTKFEARGKRLGHNIWDRIFIRN